MPELLRLETADWSLTVWSRDISKPLAVLERTLAARGKELPQTCLRFNPPLQASFGNPPAGLPPPAAGCLALPGPVFFENRQYEFDFVFADGSEPAPEPAVRHRLRSVEDAFHKVGRSVRGSINTGNDIGWFRLQLRYSVHGTDRMQSLSFEVLPVKMDMAADLDRMQQQVDSAYPLWRFSLARQTEHELAESEQANRHFPLLWLARFATLRQELEHGIRQILLDPHARLLPHERKLRAERLKGRLSGRLEQRLGEDLAGMNHTRRYPVTTRTLSADTPENRFIRMVLEHSARMLAGIGARAREADKAPDRQRLSASFFEELEKWKQPLEQLLSRPLFREIGPAAAMDSESLVLQQKPGYTGVYRVWQQLKRYLDVFGQGSCIPAKQVSELYEVWCLLEMRDLLGELGFKECGASRTGLQTDRLEYYLEEGMGAAFRFERCDGVTLRLAHEPVFRKNGDPKAGHIYSWTTTQKPDIVLEASFPRHGNETPYRIHWIFDAKYRLKPDCEEPPDDAINQMHRYRDALIHVHKAEDGELDMARPVFGAFVLFPGWVDENSAENPHQRAIEAVGVGSFPMLPGRPNGWLRAFLAEKLGSALAGGRYPARTADYHLAQDSARIAQDYLNLARYNDLTLLAGIGPGRSAPYLNGFSSGTAGWYHIPLRTTDNRKTRRTVMREIRHIGVIMPDPSGTARIVEWLYPVHSVVRKLRAEISEEQAGAPPGTGKGEYWLFRLGTPRKLGRPLRVPGITGFRYRLTNASSLRNSAEWDELPERYSFLQAAAANTGPLADGQTLPDAERDRSQA